MKSHSADNERGGMTAGQLIQSLQELERQGWPVSSETRDGLINIRLARKPSSINAWYLEYLDPDEPLEGTSLWTMEGWLVAQLEARGLRRWVWPEHNVVRVNIGTPGKPSEPNSFNSIDERVRHTELEALLACCLSLTEQP